MIRIRAGEVKEPESLRFRSLFRSCWSFVVGLKFVENFGQALVRDRHFLRGGFASLGQNFVADLIHLGEEIHHGLGLLLGLCFTKPKVEVLHETDQVGDGRLNLVRLGFLDRGQDFFEVRRRKHLGQLFER